MKSFISFLRENKKVFPKTVALLGGSYKPPHAGHWHMVLEYLKMADKVIVIISNPKSPKSIRKTKFGTVITPEISKKIFEIFVNRYNVQDKVEIQISDKPSPITALYDYTDNKLKNVNVIFGSSKKDGDEKRFASAVKYYEDNLDINLINPLEVAVQPFKSKDGIEISASIIRDNIDNPEIIRKMMPSKLTEEDIQAIIKLLSDLE